MNIRLALVSLCAALAFAGCDLGRHWLTGPLQDRVVQAEPGDRFYLHLPEEPGSGGLWRVRSDDPDAEVKVDHEDNMADVDIRIHRGFDGPATVVFRRRKTNGPEDVFTVVFYRRIADTAFWK